VVEKSGRIRCGWWPEFGSGEPNSNLRFVLFEFENPTRIWFLGGRIAPGGWGVGKKMKKI